MSDRQQRQNNALHRDSNGESGGGGGSGSDTGTGLTESNKHTSRQPSVYTRFLVNITRRPLNTSLDLAVSLDVEF